MSPSLGDNDALDARGADGTGHTCAPIDSKVILEIAAAVNPVNAGSQMLYARLEGGSNGAPQRLNLCRSKPVRAVARVDLRAVQGFIDVDVSHPGYESLVEQQGLESALSILEANRKDLGCEGILEWLRAKLP